MLSSILTDHLLEATEPVVSSRTLTELGLEALAVDQAGAEFERTVRAANVLPDHDCAYLHHQYAIADILANQVNIAPLGMESVTDFSKRLLQAVRTAAKKLWDLIVRLGRKLMDVLQIQIRTSGGTYSTRRDESNKAADRASDGVSKANSAARGAYTDAVNKKTQGDVLSPTDLMEVTEQLEGVAEADLKALTVRLIMESLGGAPTHALRGIGKLSVLPGMVPILPSAINADRPVVAYSAQLLREQEVLINDVVAKAGTVREFVVDVLKTIKQYRSADANAQSHLAPSGPLGSVTLAIRAANVLNFSTGMKSEASDLIRSGRPGQITLELPAAGVPTDINIEYAGKGFPILTYTPQEPIELTKIPYASPEELDKLAIAINASAKQLVRDRNVITASSKAPVLVEGDLDQWIDHVDPADESYLAKLIQDLATFETRAYFALQRILLDFTRNRKGLIDAMNDVHNISVWDPAVFK